MSVITDVTTGLPKCRHGVVGICRSCDTALLEACREALDRYIGTLCTRAHGDGGKDCAAAEERTLFTRLNERLAERP